MPDLIMVSNADYSYDEFEEVLTKNLPNIQVISNENSISFEIKTGNQWEKAITIEEAPEDLLFYEPEQLKKVKKIISDPIFYIVHFNDIDYAKQLLKYLVNREDVFIDPDFEMFITGKEFVNTCEKNPNWDWSYDEIFGK